MFSLGGDEDDEGFMTPGGGSSKLANLFGVDKAGGQGDNPSLKYTAPKQPKKQKESQSAQQSGGATSSLMKACAVHAYKYVDGQHASQGKVGAAVLGNAQANDYKILLYYSKTKPVTSAQISASFKFTVQKNRYATFYDDARQSWSILFENDTDIVDFAKQVAVGIANCWTPGQEALVSQDLSLGEGPSLEADDSVEVRYTGWFLQNHTIGQVFDTNVSSDKPFRFRIGKGKVIKGWDEGVIGMSKGGKRLLVVPPSLAYGAKGMGNRVPPNSTLIFETEISRVKFGRERDSSESSGVPLPALPKRDENLDDIDETVKGRSKSISERIAQAPKSDKASLLNRMKNLGQAMIPTPRSQSQSHDGDDEATDASSATEEPPEMPQPKAAKPALPHKPVITSHQPMPAQVNPMMPQAQQMLLQQQMTQQQMTQQQITENMMAQQAMLQNMQGMSAPPPSQLAVYQPMQTGFPQHAPVYGQQPPQYSTAFPQQPVQQAPLPVQPQPQPPPPPAPTPPQTQDSNLPVYFSEARQQNTEVRLSVGKMADKLDRIMEKLDMMQNTGNLNVQQMALHSSMPNMEAGMLMQNVQRLVQENDRLKKELFEKSQKIEQQNEKIAELLTRNQTFVDNSNKFIEQRNDAFKSSAAESQLLVLQLEQEKVQLTGNLSTITSQVSSLQLENGELKRTNLDLQQKLDAALTDRQGKGDEMSRLRSQLAEVEDRLSDVTRLLKEEKALRKSNASQVDTLKEELSDMKTSKELLTKNLIERKKKAATEKQRAEEEIEELKSQHEEEMTHLREKLRKQKMSTTSNTSEKLNQIEQELNAEWQTKYDKMLATTQEKHTRAMLDVHEEKQQLENRLSEMEEKLNIAKTQHGQRHQQLSSLQEQVEEMDLLRQKHEKLQGQATTMKTKYEDRITELTDENDELTEKMATLRKRFEERMTQIIQERDEAVEKAEKVAVSSQNVPTDGVVMDRGAMVAQVKKIMSSVFHALRAEFDANTKYLGKDILQVLLKNIKETTLKLAAEEEGKKEESSEEEDEEEEEEEDSEEEEDGKVVPETPLRAASLPVVENVQKSEASAIQSKASTGCPPRDVDIGPSVAASVEKVATESDDDFTSDEEENKPDVTDGVANGQQVAAPVLSEPSSVGGHQVAAPVLSEPSTVDVHQQVAPSEVKVNEVPPAPVTDIDTFQDVSDSKNVSTENGEVTETSDEELYASGSEAGLEGTKSPEEQFVDANSSPISGKLSDENSLVENAEVDDKDTPAVDLPRIDVQAPSSESNTNPLETETSLQSEKSAKSHEEENKTLLEPVPDKKGSNSDLEGSTEFEDSSRVPPPDDHKPLFGVDSDDESDPFGIGLAVKKDTPVVDTRKDRSSSSSSQSKATKDKKQEEKNHTEDDDVKPQPPPPPLFGDDDDDDDLDWFTSK